MADTDTMGYVVSTPSLEALAAYEQGVSLWLRQRSGAVEALEHAVAVDPHFPLAHCTRAYVAWRAGKVEVALAAHRQAMARADDAHDARERLHLHTVDAMRWCDGAAALRYLEQLAEQYPMDRMAMRHLGDADAVIELAQRRLQRNPNHFQSLAALAWAYGQTGNTSLQQQTYQEIMRRAEQMPVSAEVPALLEARGALQTT